MTEPRQQNRIALLATGDEVLNGDILNTNSQEIAYQLFNHDMAIGMHMVVGDTILDIKTAIQFLLQNHRVLIIIGGLGPTSDDVTRYALAEALDRPLIFHEETWSDIVNRLKKFGYDTPPDTNRRQAFFPEGASIIPNPNGTANGCYISQQDQLIFMLPGPPAECFPMLEKNVLPLLLEKNLTYNAYHQKWLLFGVSEGQIAEELDAVVNAYDCVTGYRLAYPYIEFKIFSYNPEAFAAVIPLIEKTIHPYIIQDGQKKASILLKEKLISLPEHLHITDSATGGLLESVLLTPETHATLSFSSTISEPIDSSIKISGLIEFWQAKKVSHTSLEMIFSKNNKIESYDFSIPLRGARTQLYATEFICKKILEHLLRSF